MVYIFGDCELDEHLYEMRRAGEPLKLEPKVFGILVYLICHRDRFVSRDELMEKLWPGLVISEAALTQCIAKARKAVRDDGGKQQVIKTYHGRGYRFVAEVTKSDDEPSLALRQVEKPRGSVSADDPFIKVTAQGYLREGKFSGISLLSRPYKQVGHLALVGLFLFCGVMLSMWRVSSRPSSFTGEGYTTKSVTGLETALVESDHRRLWFLSANSPEASAYSLRGWDY
jgi:DNA-binding winged helix-turn-helix (wHTH) protein